MNIFESFVSRPTPAASPHPKPARSLRVSPRWGIAWLLIALLGSGTAVHTSAQTEAPLRVAAELADDRTGTCCQVTEGDPIRFILTPAGGRSGDPSVEVRWRLYAASCDFGLSGAIPIQEGSTFVQAGDPERVLEVPTPDDWTLQTTNRCLSLEVDFPGLAAPATRYGWFYTVLDNETRFPEGVTPWLADYSSSGYSVPIVAAPDGGAYLIRDLSDYSSGTLVRIRPDLSPDPSFRAQLPAGFQPYDLESLPDGGVLVWDYRTLLKLNPQGTRDQTFQPEGLTNGVGAVKSDDRGRLYVSASRRLLRLRADGSMDPDFISPSFAGWISTIWSQGEHVYCGGKFDTVAGLAATNVAVFRLHPVTGLDSSFSLTLATNQSWISQLVETTDGKVIAYGNPLLRIYSGGGQLLSETKVDRIESTTCLCPGGSSFQWSWGSLALIDEGRVLGSSEYMDCSWGDGGGEGCQRIIGLESIETGNVPQDATRIIPSLNAAATGRLVSAGDFLWVEEKGENRIRFRRYRVTPPPQHSFGFVESKVSVTPALPHQDRGTIRRFGNSEGRVELSLMVRLLETDSTVGFEPFTTSVVMEPGDVAKPIPLPAGFRSNPNSLSRLRAELLPTEGVNVDGAGSIEFLVAGVETEPKEPVLAVHRFDVGPGFQRVLVTLSGPDGSYTLQGSYDGREWWEMDGNPGTDWAVDKISLGSDRFAVAAEINVLLDPWATGNETFLYRVVSLPSP